MREDFKILFVCCLFATFIFIFGLTAMFLYYYSLVIK